MKTIIVLRGLPGSGKSTWAKEQLKKEQGRWKRINRDDIRMMLHDVAFDPQNEDFVTVCEKSLIDVALREGYDLILDNTHLNARSLKSIHNTAMLKGDVLVIEKCFNVSLEECVKRQNNRERKVSESIITSMAQKAGLTKGRRLENKETYYPPKSQAVACEYDDTLPSAVICDLDGTLALLNGRNPYDASTCDQDLPNMSVIKCVTAMHAHGYKIIFMSGRDEKFKEPTIKFINENCNIPYELFMRQKNDTRKDSIVKRELYDANIVGKYNVAFVLDDRDQVVDLYRRELGLSVFQVNYGNF